MRCDFHGEEVDGGSSSTSLPVFYSLIKRKTHNNNNNNVSNTQSVINKSGFGPSSGDDGMWAG